MFTLQCKVSFIVLIIAKLTGSHYLERSIRYTESSQPYDYSRTGTINGERLTLQGFENIVSIQLKNSQSHLCSGVLIDLDFLITAASCLVDNDKFYASDEVSERVLEYQKNVGYFVESTD